jgi:hypothetical protein
MKCFRSCPRILTVAAAVALVLSGCVLSSTGAPGIVADESAVLTGAVKSSQAGTVTYWFAYGTTPNYGSSSTTQTSFFQQGTNTLSEVVDGLTAGTLYHYQLCSDVPDHLPPSCGADHVVTTTTGHDSVHGDGTSSYTQPCISGSCTYSDSVSIVAAVDPSSGSIESDLTFSGVAPGTPTSGPISYTGVGFIECLRVSGNIAVVGYSETFTTDFGTFTGDGELVIEDNGATGDRYLDSSGLWSPTSACPTPSASLFNSGTPHAGDFVVYDG